MKGFQTDDYMFGKYVETLKAKLDIYETILGKQKFLAGDELTLVDLFHLPYGILLPKIGVDYFQTKPNLSR
jgi:glutathione S-transferase